MTERPPPTRIELAPNEVEAGLGQIVLLVLRLLHELLERQAIRRVDGGQLSDQQIEDLGLTLQQARRHLDHLQQILVPDGTDSAGGRTQSSTDSTDSQVSTHDEPTAGGRSAARVPTSTTDRPNVDKKRSS